MPEKEVHVGIAEIKTAKDPGVLSTRGLGSCVVVALYDPRSRIGGLAHAMLPSNLHPGSNPSPGKFVDSAIATLVEVLGREGADPSALVAKIAGGANMFAAISYQAVPIGLRNAAAARQTLAARGIPLSGEDVGGTQGRMVLFDLSDGRLEVRKLNRPPIFI